MGLFKKLVGGILYESALKGKGALESWQVFKDNLLQAQETGLPDTQENEKTYQKTGFPKQGTHDRAPVQKGSIQEVEVRTSYKGGIQKHCHTTARMVFGKQISTRVETGKRCQGQRKSFYCYASSKKMK